MNNSKTSPFQKTVLITGCSSGIGLCAAKTLKTRGYRVFATARKVQDVEALQQQGFDSVLLDVCDSSSIQVAVNDILHKTNGVLDALINNAGFGQPGAIEDLSRQALRNQFETNVFGLAELTNKIIPVMRRQGHGRIINISSVLGFIALPYRGAYSASKFALEGLTDTLRLELRETGIRVCLIEPGPIVSQFRCAAQSAYEQYINTKQSVHKDQYEQMLDHITKNKNESFFTAPPDAVVKKMIHALESPHPKIRYYVTGATYLMALLKWILPYRMQDWVLARIAREKEEVKKL